MKALVGAFNQEKALVGAFSVIVHCTTSPINRFAALEINYLLSLEAASPGPAPQFAVSAALSLEAAPVYQTDREIFDFTDSRFIKPFPENQAHYPLLLPQDLDAITQAGSSKLLVQSD